MSADLVNLALCAGFSHAALLDIATLAPRLEVRDMCAKNRCGAFDACWTCPPGCGTLEMCAARMHRFSSGLLVQSTANLADPFDYPGMQHAEQRHQANFSALYTQLRGMFDVVLALGSGGCRICERCSYPEQPCRFPDRATSSMEAYGLLVADVCRANGLGYYYGPGTVSYTGCYLFSAEPICAK